MRNVIMESPKWAVPHICHSIWRTLISTRPRRSVQFKFHAYKHINADYKALSLYLRFILSSGDDRGDLCLLILQIAVR